MDDKTYLNLHTSEGHILGAAARIFTGYLAAGRVSDDDEAEWIEKSVETAIRMAVSVDEKVRTEDEML
jgi:hypothetical protein